MTLEFRKFQVHLVGLNPTRGAEMRKIRPALVISPDELNRHLSTVIIAPMTSTLKDWPCRVAVRFNGKQGQVALDQMRSIDKRRSLEYLGDIDHRTADRVSQRLREMFG